MVLVQIQWSGTGTKYGLTIWHQCGKSVKTKSYKVLGPNFCVCRSYRGKLVGRTFCTPPPSLILSRVKKTASFTHALEKNNLVHLEKQIDLDNFHIIMINNIINCYCNIIFLIMINIFVNHNSCFNLVSSSFLLYTYRGTLMKLRTCRSFFGLLLLSKI